MAKLWLNYDKDDDDDYEGGDDGGDDDDNDLEVPVNNMLLMTILNS